jgi:amidase
VSGFSSDELEQLQLTPSGSNTDRSIYLNTPLCIQVVAPKLEEEKLVQAMKLIDGALKGTTGKVAAKL